MDALVHFFGIASGSITVAHDGESALRESESDWPLRIDQKCFDCLQVAPERSFLSFLGYKFIPILPREYGGFTSRKIPKPQNLHPKLKNNLTSEDPNSTPLKN